MSFKFQSRQDTGWGLIYRLNNIMAKVERDIENGDMNRWNLHLDRIFANITFKSEAELIKDENGKITDVKLSKDDTDVFTLFHQKIESQKRRIVEAKTLEENKVQITKEMNKLYSILLMKDIWTRKLMFKLKLYLREGESDPRKAIYSG
jgi:hypothetical protein